MKLLLGAFTIGLIILGTICSVLLLEVANLTLVSGQLLMLCYVCVGIIVTFLLRWLLGSKFTLQLKRIAIAGKYLLGIIVFGGLFTYSFLFFNQYKVNKVCLTETSNVLSVGYEKLRKGKTITFAILKVREFEKKMYLADSIPIDKIQRIDVTICEGRFGIPFIADKQIF
ncbi:MAG: hypothetical protein RL660_1216 [Bacteroidota bacterium]|jgi:hypothetical protein